MAVQAFVVRRDRKPLTKETVETMYHFHVSLKLGDSFRTRMASTIFRLPNGLALDRFPSILGEVLDIGTCEF